MNIVQNASVWLSNTVALIDQGKATALQDRDLSRTTCRKQRMHRLKHCLRYPSPYKLELTRILKHIAPDATMILESGYCLVDLLDLQLGWHELETIGFNKHDLLKMGMTQAMVDPISVYAPLLQIPCLDKNEDIEDIKEIEEDDENNYYL